MKKEKVHFTHGENFESVEELLSEAMERLDEANDRILQLLQSESRDVSPAVAESPADEFTAAPAPGNDGPTAST
ncbi:MAG: hypothetical protein HYZ00_12130 [Candidatus Hydrogenedentes bacterium]|nr:hypothetical protein [Candidatus Hydrogenedentota bacterium]